MCDFIRPNKIMIALQWLCIHNPLYFDIEVNNDWIKQSILNDDNEELFKSITAAGNSNTNDNITGQDCTNLINDPVLSGPFDILYVQESKLIVSTFIMYPVMVTVFSLLL